jgi:hypothetical protein
MKAIQPSTIVCLFSFLLLFCAAMPAQEQRSASAGLVGEWCNKDFATRGNTRIHVRSDGTKLMVQMWGRCHPTECDWGETAAFQDPKDNSTWVTWTTGFSVTSQKLTLLPDGNLELAGHTHYTDSSGRADRDSKEIFVKGLVHDWSDTATGRPPVPAPPAPAQSVPVPPSAPAHVPPPPKPVPPLPKPKPAQKMLDRTNASEYPNVRFRFRTTVATAPVVYLSEREIDSRHIDPKIIIARKTGPVGTFHNILVTLPKANKDKTYHFTVIIDGQPMWTDTINVSIPGQY